MTDEDAARIEDGVRATLPSSVQPWVVAASRGRSSAWSVELTHPASNGLVIESATSDTAEALARILDILRTNPEIGLVAQAPRITHPSMIDGVRALAQVFGWSRAEVGSVARLLEEGGALNLDETRWLESSFGEDRPPSRATTIK